MMELVSSARIAATAHRSGQIAWQLRHSLGIADDDQPQRASHPGMIGAFRKSICSFSSGILEFF